MNNWDEDRSVFTGYYEIEVVIDRPVERVWEQFLDVGSWVLSHDIEEISSERRMLGAATRVAPKNVREKGVPPPQYHYCKVIKFVPPRHYILKTYSEKGGSYGGLQISAFDDARFAAMDGKTRVTLNLYCEMRGEMVAKEPSAFNLESSREGMLKNLNNLKRIVESRQ